MTNVYITVDTEYEPTFFVRNPRVPWQDHFARAIECRTGEGAVGLQFQLELLDSCGLKGVFFVDPMPALVWGSAAISAVVEPILRRGHDVQLHLHTEWLELAGERNPLGARTGGNLKDFSFDEQCVLIELARRKLMQVGAPAPVAFRAGNYGANDDTLRALAELGIGYDSSHCPGYSGSECAIGLGPEDRDPVRRLGVIEVPIGCIGDVGGLRHAQVTALSTQELTAALAHARDHAVRDFTIVSHSFELLSRDRTRINWIVKRRFEQFCDAVGRMEGLVSRTYSDGPPAALASSRPRPTLPASILRSSLRMAEQALVNAVYGMKAKSVVLPLMALGALSD